MTKKPNSFEIKQRMTQAILLADVININALSRATGHERKTILKYIEEVRGNIVKYHTIGFRDKDIINKKGEK